MTTREATNKSELKYDVYQVPLILFSLLSQKAVVSHLQAVKIFRKGLPN